MATLKNARIDQLPLNAVLKAGFWVPVRNMDNSTTERFDIGQLLISTTSGNFEYNGLAYLQGVAVTWKGDWYQALQDVPAGIVPGSEPGIPVYWEEISKSDSGLVFWRAGVFPQDDVFVLFDVDENPLAPNIKFFYLKNPTRPFVSTNFLTELADGDWEQALNTDPVPQIKSFIVAASDETSPVSTGLKTTFRMPYAMTLTGIKASLTTAQVSGSTFTVDVWKNGVTIFSTLLTIDNTEKTSVTAAIPAVISVPVLNDDDEITIRVTAIGNNTATGLKITFVG